MQSKLKFVVCAAFMLMTGGCVSALNASIPDDGYHTTSNVAYGKNPRQTLDIYVPENLHGKADVLVFFHGGSWQHGTKEDYKFVGEAFASLGYVTVLAEYRNYPEVYFPDFMEDSANALVWVHKHIGEYGGDANNVFLSGHSAGAYNAVMLTLNPRYLKRAGGSTSYIRGTLGLAGPYDFLPMTDEDIIAVFSKKPAAETQPITYATHKTVPMFIATGSADDLVGPKNSINLTAALKAQRSPVEFKSYDNLGHVGIVLSLASGFRGKAPTRADMDDFMKRHRVGTKTVK